MSQLAKDATSTVFALIGLCILLVNVFGGLVAGIWLLAKGEWRLVVSGFLLSFVMPTAWTIASLPAMGFAAMLFAKDEAPSRPAMAAGGFIISIWNAVLISMWCASVFFLFSGRIRPGLSIPLLLWAYSTTMAPLAYMASKDREDNVGTAIGTLFAVAAFVVLLIVYLADGTKPVAMTMVVVLALVQAVLTTSLGVAMTPPRQSRRARPDQHLGPPDGYRA